MEFKSEENISDVVDSFKKIDAENKASAKCEFTETALAFLYATVRGLVDHQDDVKVSHSKSDSGFHHFFELTVNSNEKGKIIGKHGRTAHAIKLLLDNMTRRFRVNASLEIVE